MEERIILLGFYLCHIWVSVFLRLVIEGGLIRLVNGIDLF